MPVRVERYGPNGSIYYPPGWDATVRFVAGVDLGQAQDHTAVAVLELDPPLPGMRNTVYQLRHLERYPLHTPYPSIVDDVKAMLNQGELKGCTQMVVDATGVGAPVVDLFWGAGIGCIAATITAGDQVHREARKVRVPKRELVGTLQVLLQQKRLQIAQDLPLTRVLVEELANFRANINLQTGNDSYEAWRERDHDDLVLALALAAWQGTQPFRRPRPILVRWG